jgi:hypothetical protein
MYMWTAWDLESSSLWTLAGEASIRLFGATLQEAHLNSHRHDDLKTYISFFTYTFSVGVKYSQQTSKETQVFWVFKFQAYVEVALSRRRETWGCFFFLEESGMELSQDIGQSSQQFISALYCLVQQALKRRKEKKISALFLSFILFLYWHSYGPFDKQPSNMYWSTGAKSTSPNLKRRKNMYKNHSSPTNAQTVLFFINCNTLLHVSTLLGHLLGEHSAVVTLRLHFIFELLTVYCVASRTCRSVLQLIKKLFVHLLVINVFLYNIVHRHGTH